MRGISQIRGVLLEEAVLQLLSGVGYKTVERRGNDPTLRDGSAGLEVCGRGEWHQIDAIADFFINPPFTNPPRLLLEAKSFDPGRKVDMSIVRNAVGTLKDVAECWVSASRGNRGSQQVRDHTPAHSRYHYQYALFSASGYTATAQRYAFAQDIYLIQLAQSAFFRPVLDAIRNVRLSPRHAMLPTRKQQLHRLRVRMREALREHPIVQVAAVLDVEEQYEGLNEFVRAAHAIRFALLGMIGGRFPVFLVPNPERPDLTLNDDHYLVRIRFDPSGWYLENRRDERLFSFDLPRELLEMYASGGLLTRAAALDMKEQQMSRIEAMRSDGVRIRLITFELDSDWLNQVRRRS